MQNPFAINRIKSRLSQSELRVGSSVSLFLSNPRLFDITFIVLIALVLLHGRWASIVYPLPLNPDEAQATANALRIKAYGFNWNVLDGSTNGPLDSLAVCWPYLFGWDPTLNTTHLTACMLIALTCAYIYLSMKAVSGRAVAALLVLPLAVFYAFTTDNDFLHYQSELLPVFLLVVAHYLAAGISVNRVRQVNDGVMKYALLGFILGMVPFAKLQAAPISAAIGLYGLFLATTDPWKYRIGKSLALICGGLAPACAFLVPLLVSGHIQDFWRSYIAYAFLYIHRSLSISDLYSFIGFDLLLKCVSYFVFSLSAVALLHSLSMPKERDVVIRKAIHRDAVYGVMLVLVAFWAIATPGNGFPHYLTFYPPFVLILCAYFARAFSKRRRDIILFFSYYAVLVLMCVSVFLWAPRARFQTRILNNNFGSVVHRSFEIRSPRLLSWLPIPATHLLVWGWMPEWYVWSGLTPASRETNTYLEINDTALRSYFRSRFMSDIEASSPDIVMDGVSKGSFFFKGWSFHGPSEASPATFPEFAAYLSDHYVQLPPWQAEPDCSKLYVKNELKSVIDSRIIVPAAVSTSADFHGPGSPFTGAKLFDNSVTEDICDDYWLLPNRSLGSVTVTFSKAETVSSVMILNTRNGIYLDRGAEDVQVKFLKGGAVVSTQKVTVEPYPYWTTVRLPTLIQADQMEIDVLSFVGRGGGLNEVKIFRAEPATAPVKQPG